MGHLDLLSELVRSDRRLQGGIASFAHRHGLTPTPQLAAGADIVERALEALAACAIENSEESWARVRAATALLEADRNPNVSLQRAHVVRAVDRAVFGYRFALVPPNDPSVPSNPRATGEAVAELAFALRAIDAQFGQLDLDAIEQELAAAGRAEDLGEDVGLDDGVHPSVWAICAKLALSCRAFGDEERDSDAARRGGEVKTSRVGAVDRVSATFRTAFERRRANG